jgi:hypothetical protein
MFLICIIIIKNLTIIIRVGDFLGGFRIFLVDGFGVMIRVVRFIIIILLVLMKAFFRLLLFFFFF